MPYRDKTGPNGAGPGTGRGMGPCVDNSFAGYGRRGGMGFRHGAGFGNRGFGRMGYGYENPGFQVNEKEYLTGEVEMLEKNLESLKNRLKEIESDKKK
ncbi:MAG: DUF5320 domain-containing protein [Acidobacteriota bacterium]